MCKRSSIMHSSLRQWMTRAGLAAALLLAPLAARAEMVLLMFEQPGCIYCRQWDEEISGKYELTDEGRAAPLQRLVLRADMPAGIELDRPALFTPTFVLLRGGREVGRIEGYPGEDFFWGLLGALIAKAKGI